MKNIKNKKSQITIFVVIALIIVAVLALIFVLKQRVSTNISPEQNPEAYMTRCISDSLASTELKILEGNGYINKTENYILYSLNRPGERVPYLCKASQFYNPCINQDPMFIERIRGEFSKQTAIDAERCFSEIADRAVKNGYDITLGNMSLSVVLGDKSVSINLLRRMTMKKDSITREYSQFSGIILSPIYRLADTARIIINYESTLCEFDSLNWMKTSKDIAIYKFTASDQTKIYTLTDKTSEKKLSFAIKTCLLPAGI